MRYSYARFFSLGLLPVLLVIISNITQLVKRNDVVTSGEVVFDGIVLTILTFALIIRIGLKAKEHGQVTVGFVIVGLLLITLPAASSLLTILNKRVLAVTLASLILNLCALGGMLVSFANAITTISSERISI